MCWTPHRVTQSRHWPWGLACHGVHLFAPPLCKKPSGGQQPSEQLLQSLYMETGKPLKLQRNKLFMEEEKCLLVQCLCPLCDKQFHNMATAYAHPSFHTEICSIQLNWTDGLSCSGYVKGPWWLCVDTKLIFKNCWYSNTWGKNTWLLSIM